MTESRIPEPDPERRRKIREMADPIPVDEAERAEEYVDVPSSPVYSSSSSSSSSTPIPSPVTTTYVSGGFSWLKPRYTPDSGWVKKKPIEKGMGTGGMSKAERKASAERWKQYYRQNYNTDVPGNMLKQLGFRPVTQGGVKKRSTVSRRARATLARRVSRAAGQRWTIGASAAALRGGDTRLFVRNKRGKWVSYRRHVKGVERWNNLGKNSPLYPYVEAVRKVKAGGGRTTTL